MTTETGRKNDIIFNVSTSERNLAGSCFLLPGSCFLLPGLLFFLAATFFRLRSSPTATGCRNALKAGETGKAVVPHFGSKEPSPSPSNGMAEPRRPHYPGRKG